MSSTLRVLSTHELVLVVCRYATTFTILSLSQTSRMFTRTSREALRIRVDQYMTLFFPDAPALRQLLTAHNSNISGDVPLQVLLTLDDYIPLDNPVLTINVPRGAGFFFRSAFFGVGYKRMKYFNERVADSDPQLVDPTGAHVRPEEDSIARPDVPT